MHAYSTNCPHQVKLIACLGILSVSISGFTSWGIAQAGALLGWSLLVGGVSSITVFSALWLLADKVIWKWKLPRRFLLIPDLNGAWKCTGQTVFKSGQRVEYNWSAQVTIVQSWSRISIVLKTEQSDSESIAASLQNKPGQGYRLIYHYDNSPKINEDELNRHSGLADLMFNPVESMAEGQYFTDKDRMTYGSMKLERIGDASE